MIWQIRGFPAGQPRIKARVVEVVGRRSFAQVYTPKGPCSEWKDAIRFQVGRCPSPETDPRKPYYLSVTFRFRRPKSHPKKNPPIWHTTAPDGDNAWKAVADVLTELGWVYDDSQIAHHEARKVYSEEPGAEIVLERLLEPDWQRVP